MPYTYYQTLGVAENATEAEIEAAFKSKASEVHPDRISPSNPYLKNIAAEAFKGLSEAKAVLLDGGKRQKYDAELAYSRCSSPNAPPAPSPTPGDTACARGAPAAQASRPSRPYAWLTNTPSGRIALSVALGALLLAGGIALRRASSTVNPPRIAPEANSAGDPGSADACKAGADCTGGGSAGKPPAKANESSQAGKKSHATANTRPNAGDPRSHLQ